MFKLLTELLFDAADKLPNHLAVEDASDSLTYAALAERASKLAAILKESTVRGDRVGVLMPKSCDSVVALYGIMAAGGAYVPLDIGSPDSRLAAMIKDSGMTALVADRRQAERLITNIKDVNVRTIIVPDLQDEALHAVHSGGARIVAQSEIEQARPVVAPLDLKATDLAYILYTSGSTGVPKGVMISHANAMAFVEWACKMVGVTSTDRLSSHAPFHFDLSIFDLYAACLGRATLSIVPDGLSSFPVRLAEWIDRQRISVWYSVPSILVQLWDRGRLERFAFEHLRSVCFAGEVFSTKYLRSWMERFPRVKWFNWYGPTETNVCTSYSPTAVPPDDTPIPIGTPASGAAILLLKDDGTVVNEADVEGEIWVDGPTVAKGYWGDAKKTSDRFIPRSELTGHQSPIYRTGDLACRNIDGELVFKGRRDAMIKSRGYRIELGEIEAALSSHPSIQEACAVPIPDAEAGHRIRACVVGLNGAQLDRPTIERHLTERIPRYMLPQEVCFLEAMPRTSTGKIDRKSLERMTVTE